MPGTAVHGRSPFHSRRRRSRREDVPAVLSARVDADAVTVTLEDGRAVSVPLAWSARLLYATPDERADVETDPFGLYWPQLNESWSVVGMLAGCPSAEGPESLNEWRARMDRRRAQIEAGKVPEPHFPTLPLPEWWDEDDEAAQ